jgi:RNA polymerase sigma factor (sigma-70 family)
MIYDFLNRPRHIKSQITIAEKNLEDLRLSMYPSAIRYDRDKVQSSPSDPMPRYAEKVDELQTQIKKLQLEYLEARDAITNVALTLNYKEQEVIMLRYVARCSWRMIAFELNCTEDWVFKLHRKAVKNLIKSFPEL